MMIPQHFEDFLAADPAVIRVHITDVQGSSPRGAGTEMFVTATGTLGTIGGGRLEYLAIDAAHRLLSGSDTGAALDIPLGPEIGQCCGGRVSVALTRMNAADKQTARRRLRADNTEQPHIYIMGGGHVGRALADQLQHLPFRTILIDQREAELARCTAGVEKRLSAIPESDISTAAPASAFVILTHDHALDFLLTGAALERGDAAYVGLIGSATKRAKFTAWFRHSSPASRPDALTCPIGARATADKRPQVIAAFAAAEITAALTPARARSLPDKHTADAAHIPARKAAQ